MWGEGMNTECSGSTRSSTGPPAQQEQRGSRALLTGTRIVRFRRHAHVHRSCRRSARQDGVGERGSAAARWPERVTPHDSYWLSSMRSSRKGRRDEERVLLGTYDSWCNKSQDIVMAAWLAKADQRGGARLWLSEREQRSDESLERTSL
ncbi:hypothetical protein B0H13DRAFT_1880618 [Mycena leptocephala]|nr:hypothetical protein B0H13DRAFT_1880618 [Mycena leptocephala]